MLYINNAQQYAIFLEPFTIIPFYILNTFQHDHLTSHKTKNHAIQKELTIKIFTLSLGIAISYTNTHKTHKRRHIHYVRFIYRVSGRHFIYTTIWNEWTNSRFRNFCNYLFLIERAPIVIEFSTGFVWIILNEWVFINKIESTNQLYCDVCVKNICQQLWGFVKCVINYGNTIWAVFILNLFIK